MGSILQNGMFSESKLTACLAAIIAEVAFIQEMEQDNNKILIAVSCSALFYSVPDISSRSLQFIYCMTKASFVTTIQ